MRIPRSDARRNLSFIWLTLFALLFSSCGLALDNQAKLERGQEAFANGEYRAAMIDAKAVLQDEPDNLDARLLLGRVSVVVGDGAAAEKELRRAIELGVDQSEVITDLGRALLLQGKFGEVLTEISTDLAPDQYKTTVMRIRADAHLGLQQAVEARELYTEVLSIDESDLYAQLGIANTYLAERNRMQARETLNHVLATGEDFVPALQMSGMLSLQTRDIERAVRDFSRAAELAKAGGDMAGEIQALYGLSEALFLQQDVDATRPVLERMQEVAPADVRTMMTAARIAAADQEWTAAQEILQQVLRRAPEFRMAQFLLGAVHKENGNLGQAEMYLSAVVAATPENARARRLLAETRLALDKDQEARQALEPLISGDSTDIVSLSMAAGADLNLGEVDEAIALLEQGVAANPGNADLKVQLALAYFRNQQFDRAQEVLDALPDDMSGERTEFGGDVLAVLASLSRGERAEALADARAVREKWPGQADAHALVGSIEMAMGELENARASFVRGLDIAPEDVRTLRYLAQIDMAEGDPESARDRYLVILELAPDDAGAMVSLARLAARAEKQDEAREWLEKARRSAPESVSARSMLAAYHLAYRDFKSAEEVATEALALDADNPKLLNLLGLAQLYSQNYREAVFSLGKAAELDPEDPNYRLNLAKAQAAQGNQSSAIVTLEKALDESLQHLPSGLLLASLKADRGDIDGARDLAGQLADLHPDAAAPLALQAEILARQGDLQAAISTYDAVLDKEVVARYAVRAYQMRKQAGIANQVAPLVRFLDERPLDSTMRNFLADAYNNLGETGNANRQYEQVLEQEPDNYIAANNLAWNYFVTDDDRAEAMARRAYELRPDSGAVADTLGWILVKKGELEEGISTLRSAVELSEGRAAIRYHLAAALVESGEADEARQILEEIVNSDESFADKDAAKALLENLGS